MESRPDIVNSITLMQLTIVLHVVGYLKVILPTDACERYCISDVEGSGANSGNYNTKISAN